MDLSTRDVDTDVGAVLCNCGAKWFNNASINVEEIITGHARLSWNTSRNDDNIGSLQSFAELLLTHVASNLQVAKGIWISMQWTLIYTENAKEKEMNKLAQIDEHQTE